jgi:hypothetical protein
VAESASIAIVPTGIAALVLASMFAFGRKLHPLRALVPDRRALVSFSAGMAAAYVFVHLMPELHAARSAFTHSVSTPMPYAGKSIYFVALLGFLAFYALEHLRTQWSGHGASHHEQAGFRLHIGGFAAYAGLVGYLLVRNLHGGGTETALYTTAIACHFLAIDHALDEEHGQAYRELGRWLLAGVCLLGWIVGVWVALPPQALAMLLAFLSGAVIMNSALMELSPDKAGRFTPFLVGGIAYGLLLLPLS